MINGQEMNMALGLPIYLDGFLDGVPRRCVPYQLSDFYELSSYLQFINSDFDENFKSEESIKALYEIFSRSFCLEDNVDDVLKNVDASNFSDLIGDVKTINGVCDQICDSESSFNSDDGIDWGTSVSAVMVYSGCSIEDILKMTFPQFNRCLNEIGKRINWEYKVGTLDLVEHPDEHLSDGDHPLSPEKSRKNKKGMTMKDIQGFQ